MENTIKNIIKNSNIYLEDKQIEQFCKYYELIIEWNEKINLTAITECEEVAEKHFIDSLSINKIVNMENVEKIIDVGTGAGFPGIPIKIAYPHLKITLLDSLNKRIKFLREVISILELENIEVIHGRAEDIARKEEYREKYDICVSRAVANLSTLSEYCLPFVKVGGSFISYKAEKADEEIKKAENAISILGGIVEKTEKFQLSGTEIGRMLVKIKKEKNTKKKYPRKAGTPSKEPL